MATIFGSRGSDTLLGTSQDDTISGLGGNDVLSGGLGNDALFGGEGFDTADFSHWDVFTGHRFMFDTRSEARRSHDGKTERDSLDSIEIIRGTSHADDFSGGGTFDGRGGDDTFHMSAGSTFHGGEGYDFVFLDAYAIGGAGITVDLANGGSGGAAEGSRYSSIERVQTGGNDDFLLGDNFGNDLYAMEGRDTLNGRGGDDQLFAGSGDDTLIGGSEIDIERLTGGSGRDTFVYNARNESNTTATRTGDFILDFNANEDLIDLRTLGVSSTDLMITNFTGADGTRLARVLEDLNHNGVADGTELSINIVVQGTAEVSLADVLI